MKPTTSKTLLTIAALPTRSGLAAFLFRGFTLDKNKEVVLDIRYFLWYCLIHKEGATSRSSLGFLLRVEHAFHDRLAGMELVPGVGRCSHCFSHRHGCDPPVERPVSGVEVRYRFLRGHGSHAHGEDRRHDGTTPQRVVVTASPRAIRGWLFLFFYRKYLARNC